MNVRKQKTYTQYQVDKLIEVAQKQFEEQWQSRLSELEDKTFENVKVDMFSQFMSIAMSTLIKFHDFDKESASKFYENFFVLLHMMKDDESFMGNCFTPQDCVNYISSSIGIELDKH